MKLFFIHGSGSNSVVWEGLLDHLSDEATDGLVDGFVAVDLPGHPNGKLCSSIIEYAQYVSTKIDAETEPVVVIGHSLGGGIALQLALDFSDKLAGVILIGSGARLRVLPSLLDNLRQLVDSGDHSVPPEVCAMNGMIIEPLQSKINKVIKENGVSVLLSDLTACDQFDVMSRISEIKVPLQLICGDRDIMTPPKYSEHLAQQLDRAYCDIVSGATHMVMSEKPAEVAGLIKKFLSALE